MAGSLKVSWQIESLNQSLQKIYRQFDDKPNEVIASIGAAETTYIDTNVLDEHIFTAVKYSVESVGRESSITSPEITHTYTPLEPMIMKTVADGDYSFVTSKDVGKVYLDDQLLTPTINGSESTYAGTITGGIKTITIQYLHADKEKQSRVVVAKGISELVQWGSVVESGGYALGADIIKVPNHLPITVTSLVGLFSGSILFDDNDVTLWDVSRVTSLQSTFRNARAFNQNLSQWCVGLIPSIPEGFNDSGILTPENTPVWGTCPSEVIVPEADEMYFTTTAGELSYQGYYGDTITLSNGTTITVNDPNANSYTVPAGKHKVKLVDGGMGYVGISGQALTELHNFPTLSSITKLSFFASLVSPNLVKVPDYLPSNITDISLMFYLANAFNQDISMWNTSKVTNMANMFYGASSFNQNLSQWCVGLITALPDGFKDISALSVVNTPKWGTCPRGENIGPAEMLFTTTAGTLNYQGNSGDKITLSNKSVITIANGNIRSFTVPAGKHKVKLVESRSGFVAISGSPLTEVNILPTIPTVNHIQYYCDNGGSPNLVKVPAALPSNLTNLSNMFRAATNFNQPIGNWDLSKVTNISGLFADATSFNQPIGSWIVSNVVNMTGMFNYASSFNKNISQWCVGLIPSLPGSFKDNSPLSVANTPVWGTCPRGENLV